MNIRVAETVKFLAVCALIFGIVHEASTTIQTFAGKTTTADLEAWLSIGFLSGPTSLWRIVICAMMVMMFYLWGSIERGLRKRTVRHIGNQKRVLEEQLDPSRTSSGLSSTGDTNPDDE